MKLTTLTVLLGLVGSCAAAPTTELGGDARGPDGNYKYTNLLIHEKSPYLLQHAHNPVDWHPWGPEAFALAKSQNKPIFLSIGYSTCHWCHVMERESFSDPAIAKLINEHFVPIKVDREERPDVDRIYMEFIEATTGSGGWPMTVFLTPDLKPFFGGTYFPPEDAQGMPGLTSLLPKVTAAWDKDHDAIVASGDKMVEALKKMGTLAPDPAAGGLDAAVLAAAANRLKTEFDPEHGGFGTAPKFPQPVLLRFLLVYAVRAKDDSPRDMALQTLRAMADGGMHDQIGGGFHRYSTDSRWFLPHFEKMLYDQAQLADVYLDAYQVTHDPVFADTARDVLEYVLRDMTGEQGQFFSAQDADSAPDADRPNAKREGAFYVWTADEIAKALGPGASMFDYRYGIADGGNVSVDPRGEFPSQNVLFIAHSMEDVAKKFNVSPEDATKALDASRQRILAVRSQRPRPSLDDKSIVAWNGLMIGAFARAGLVLREPRYTAAAARAAGFIQNRLLEPKTIQLAHSFRDGATGADGFLTDYAFLISGLIDLYESSADIAWLKLALDLQAKQDALFWDPQSGGYFSTPAADTLLVRLKDDSDDAEPSGNSVAAVNLLRLAHMTDDKDLATKAQQTLALFSTRLRESPTSLAQMLVALDLRLSAPQQVVLAGEPGAVRPMAYEVADLFLPHNVLLYADGGPGQQFLGQHAAFIQDIKAMNHQPTAYVCKNFACQAPTNDADVLRKMLKR